VARPLATMENTIVARGFVAEALICILFKMILLYHVCFTISLTKSFKSGTSNFVIYLLFFFFFLQLTQAVGKVRVARPTGDYSAYETARETVLAERDYPHVLEVYGFSAEFKTQDLMAILQPVAGTTGCDLKWVDDTHALAVFSNSQIGNRKTSLLRLQKI
jgi:hypothetical protein